jgi:hypothetical protein
MNESDDNPGNGTTQDNIFLSNCKPADKEAPLQSFKASVKIKADSPAVRCRWDTIASKHLSQILIISN